MAGRRSAPRARLSRSDAARAILWEGLRPWHSRVLEEGGPAPAGGRTPGKTLMGALVPEYAVDRTVEYDAAPVEQPAVDQRPNRQRRAR